jgi:hypothetical protein
MTSLLKTVVVSRGAGARAELNPRPTDYEGQEALTPKFFAVAELHKISIVDADFVRTR